MRSNSTDIMIDLTKSTIPSLLALEIFIADCPAAVYSTSSLEIHLS